MSIIKSISISQEFDRLASENKISWSEAAKIGMSIMLGDLGIREYDNNLNLFRKMQVIRQNLEETTSKYLDLVDKAKKKGLIKGNNENPQK